MLRLRQERFDLVVLDVEAPKLGQLQHGRIAPPQDVPPVLFLAGPEALPSLAPALDPDQKDYVTKPFRMSEMLVRIQVLLRGRTPARPESGSMYRDLVLDDTTGRARRAGTALDLTPAEYRLLRHLLANAGQAIPKEQISRWVWGQYRAGNAIEKLVSRLRIKVDRDGPALIHTRRGFGYWFGVDPGESVDRPWPCTTSPTCDRGHVRDLTGAGGMGSAIARRPVALDWSVCRLSIGVRLGLVGRRGMNETSGAPDGRWGCLESPSPGCSGSGIPSFRCCG